jgi:hypothetical protein
MIHCIRKIFEYSVSTYFGGAIWIIFGIFMLFFTKRNPQKYKFSVLQGDVKDIGAGYGSIVLGIIIIILKCTGKI